MSGQKEICIWRAGYIVWKHFKLRSSRLWCGFVLCAVMNTNVKGKMEPCYRPGG